MDVAAANTYWNLRKQNTHTDDYYYWLTNSEPELKTVPHYSQFGLWNNFEIGTKRDHDTVRYSFPDCWQTNVACHLTRMFEMNLEFFGLKLECIDIFRVHASVFLVTLTTDTEAVWLLPPSTSRTSNSNNWRTGLIRIQTCERSQCVTAISRSTHRSRLILWILTWNNRCNGVCVHVMLCEAYVIDDAI